MTNWRPSSYSGSELMQMQQDARRRVQEMQQRARRNLEQSGAPPPVESPRPNLPPGLPVPDFVQPRPEPPAPAEEKKSGLMAGLRAAMDGFGIENDHLILLLIIFLLLEAEDTDKTLLLALGYLLL